MKTTKKKPPTQSQLRRAFERTNKLSTILTIALYDLKKVERSKKFRVDMNVWNEKNHEANTCTVCFAGSVMACRYGNIAKELHRNKKVDLWNVHHRKTSLEPLNFSEFDEATSKFYALDWLRSGKVSSAESDMGVPEYKQHPELNRNVSEYADSGPKHDRWWADMRKLLKDLKAAGL